MGALHAKNGKSKCADASDLAQWCALSKSQRGAYGKGGNGRGRGTRKAETDMENFAHTFKITTGKHYTYVLRVESNETAAVSACPNINIDVQYVELQVHVHMNTVREKSPLCDLFTMMVHLM